MRILVLNPGSATLKFRLLDLSGDGPGKGVRSNTTALPTLSNTP